MSAAHDVGTCRQLERRLSAYVDKELDAVHSLEVEDHLADCGHCSEHVALLTATRASLCYVSRCKAPSSLRERICRVMVEENQLQRAAEPVETASAEAALTAEEAETAVNAPGSLREPLPSVAPTRAAKASTSGSGGGDSRLFRGMRYAVPLAAAATVLLVFGVMRLQEQELSETNSGYTPEQAVASLDYLVDEMVSLHAHPLPPETTDPDMRDFDPHLGLRVRRPTFDSKKVRYLGARMMPRQSAMLQYVLDRKKKKHRVTMYVFNPKNIPLRGNRLQKRHIGARKVLVGRVRGYSVAASERDGVGYALATDLGDDESAKLLLTASR